MKNQIPVIGLSQLHTKLLGLMKNGKQLGLNVDGNADIYMHTCIMQRC